MNDSVRHFRDFIVSLKLTVVLLALGLLLVFAATLAQVDLGIWDVQENFFRSFVAIWHVGRIYLPLPGGYLVGGVLLINLIAAHVHRFKFTARKSGIFLTHLGLILLLLGELLSGLWQEDFRMRITEGETKNYAESYRVNELTITDTTDPKFDDVVAIPEALLARGEPIQSAKLPFKVVVKSYFPNSMLAMRGADSGPAVATAGIGQRVIAAPQPPTYKPDEQNVPAAFIELVAPENSVGTWLVRLPTQETPFPPQTFDYAGHSWKIALRPQRNYKPFSLTLEKFSHDVYLGTSIPKNYSSRLHLANPASHEDREVLIYMNNPLRYAGLTFYQSGYEGEHTTILQVVRNPSWQLPYLACTMMALGLVIQFCIHLVGFIGKRRRTAAVPA